MGTMNGTFNGQILVDKLSKLNGSQQSIETLSHWCIFHRKNAKQVVETWERQFHCAPKNQWVCFLYLANDILQNSRRKGSEFVTEFWKVLPDALKNVIENGDEFGRNAAMRLIDIWEERKVFGSRGQVLKEEILGRNINGVNIDGKISHNKIKQSAGEILEKLISNYERVYEGPVDEEMISGKCQNAVDSIEKTEKEIGGNFVLGNVNGSQVVEELKGQSNVLRECIEQLKVAESSRVTLVSYLREALHEQELKLEQVRNQIQAAQFRVEQAGSICQQLMVSVNGQLAAEPRLKETGTFPDVSPGFIQETQSTAVEKEQSAPVKYVQEPFPANSTHTEEHRKTAAAAVAAKLAASTSSAEMLSYVLSSLASEGVIRPQMKEDFASDSKRTKIDNGLPFMPSQASQHPNQFPHVDTFQQAATSQPQIQHSPAPMQHPGPPMQQPPPPPPPLQPPMQPPMPPPPPPTQYMQAAGSMTAVPYTYGSASAPPQRPPSMPGFPLVSLPPYPNQPNPYQNFQASESGFFSQPPVPATTPSASSRQ